MGLFQTFLYSKALTTEVMVDFIVPQNTEKEIGNLEGGFKDLPVVYLLHGMGGNASVWRRRTAIERYANDRQVAVVMPSTELAWYTNTTYGMNYWTFIADELPDLVAEFFPQITKKREKTFVAGLSMGGFGALKLGLLRPERFSKVVALSAALAVNGNLDTLLQTGQRAYWEGIFGPLEDLPGSKNDPDTWMNDSSLKVEKPKIFMATGKSDPLLLAGELYAEKLIQKDFPAEFHVGKGAHEWVFWDEWIQHGLDWLMEKEKEN